MQSCAVLERHMYDKRVNQDFGPTRSFRLRNMRPSDGV
jgi:hypothetical protein